jgi:hypothetical protein
MACEMDKRHKTLVEDKFPLGRMVNIAQDTSKGTERERPGKCLEALMACLCHLACLLP